MGADWIGIIALGVGFVIWLISTIVRANEAPRRPGAPAANEPPRHRPSSTEIDRFLEEINRRRQQQQQRRPAPAELAEPAPVARPRMEERPRPKPQPAPKPQRPTVRSAYSAPPPVQSIPAVLPVALPLEPVQVKQVQAIRPAPMSPQLRAARDLLATGQGLRTAIILQEIFGPPRSKRPR